MPRYEIKVNSEWAEVAEHVFRSWSGARCLNGKAYHGPRYYFMSAKYAEGVMQDLCADCETIVTHHDANPNDDIVCPGCDDDRLSALEYAAERDAEDRYYHEGRYARA